MWHLFNSGLSFLSIANQFDVKAEYWRLRMTSMGTTSTGNGGRLWTSASSHVWHTRSGSPWQFGAAGVGLPLSRASSLVSVARSAFSECPPSASIRPCGRLLSVSPGYHLLFADTLSRNLIKFVRSPYVSWVGRSLPNRSGLNESSRPKLFRFAWREPDVVINIIRWRFKTSIGDSCRSRFMFDGIWLKFRFAVSISTIFRFDTEPFAYAASPMPETTGLIANNRQTIVIGADKASIVFPATERTETVSDTNIINAPEFCSNDKRLNRVNQRRYEFRNCTAKVLQETRRANPTERTTDMEANEKNCLYQNLLEVVEHNDSNCSNNFRVSPRPPDERCRYKTTCTRTTFYSYEKWCASYLRYAFGGVWRCK